MSLEESKRPIDQGDLKRLKVIRGGNHAKVTKIQHEALSLISSETFLSARPKRSKVRMRTRETTSVAAITYVFAWAPLGVGLSSTPSAHA